MRSEATMSGVLGVSLVAALWVVGFLWWQERMRANRAEALLAATLRGRAAVEGALADALVREEEMANQLQATAQIVEAAKGLLRGKAYEMVISLPVVKRPGGGTWSQN